MTRRKPSKADIARFDKLYSLGDIVAKMRAQPHEPATLHHITSGGRRLGHKFTIPLNPWRHQGTVLPGETSSSMKEVYGPSLAKSRAEFEAAYGTELELLAETNRLIGE